MQTCFGTTTVTKIVDPDNGTGTDYTSLDSWEDDLGDTTSGNLVSDDEIAVAQCRSTSDANDTDYVAISGWTTGESNYILIEGIDFPSDGVWDDSAYVIENNSATYAIGIFEEYVRIRKIQCYVTAGNGFYIGSIGSTNQIYFDSCIVKGTGSAATIGINSYDSDSTATVYNCIVYDHTNGSNGQGIKTYGTNNIYNCTVYNCYQGIFGATGTCVAKNCAVGNCADDFLSVDTIEYCCSDDGDDTGSGTAQNPNVSWDGEFVTPGSDFTLESGGNCVGNGTDNPGSNLYLDDIIDTSRSSTWDIGAFEYQNETTTTPQVIYIQTGAIPLFILSICLIFRRTKK